MKKFLILIASTAILGGCINSSRKVHASKLSTISIGMKKQQIINMLGEPIVVRGSMTNKFGQVIEVWEYFIRRDYTSGEAAKITLTMGALFLIGGGEDVYWFYFHDDKLVQWCKAGDWETAAHDILEIRYR